MNLKRLNPAYGSGQSLVTGASAQIAIPPEAKQIVLTNTGSVVVFVRIGNGAFSATAADYPVTAGQQKIITKGDGQDKIAAWSSAAGALHVMAGEGL